MRHHILSATAITLAVALTGYTAQAAWPEGPLTMFVDARTGGTTDAQGRVLAEVLGAELGVPITVVNKPGGDGTVAAMQLKQEAPDGDTFMFANSIAYTFNTAALPVDFSLDDFAYAGAVTVTQPALIALTGAPYDDYEGWLAYAREHPGMTYATITKLDRLIMNAIMDKEQIDIRIVPAEGGGGMVPMLLGQQVDFAYSGGVHNRYPDEMKVIVALSGERAMGYPDTPTLGEFGYEFSAENFRMVIFPKGVDPAIVERMETALKKVTENDQFVDFTQEKLQFPVVFIGGEKLEQDLRTLAAAHAELVEKYSEK